MTRASQPRRRVRALLTIAALTVAALIISGPPAIGQPAHTHPHVHGVCHNPDSTRNTDLLVYCADFYTHIPKPPLLPRLIVQWKIHANHAPQSILLVVKLYKWPAHGDHAHLYRFCIAPDGRSIDCDHSWVTKDMPAPGTSELYEFRAECQAGRYYVYFQYHGVSSSGIPEDGHWYDPHPSNKTDQTPPNRQESVYVSPAGGPKPSC